MLKPGGVFFIFNSVKCQRGSKYFVKVISTNFTSVEREYTPDSLTDVRGGVNGSGNGSPGHAAFRSKVLVQIVNGNRKLIF